MRIPILDLSPEVNAHWEEFTQAAASVLKSTHFIMGPNVLEFEKEVANYLGVKHAIACNSGTDALVIGLRALGIQAGDEVLTTAFTFFATAEAISVLGATPVFVDIDPLTFNIDVDQIESRITEETKAVIPVHLYGQPVAMDPLLTLAKRHGLKILEDVAQAMGAGYHGKKVGSFGDIGAFSFFPSKNLGAFGDGGLMTTQDDTLAEQCRMLRVHGSKKKYFNEAVGYNSRLDELQAAFLRIKLRHLETANEGRRQAAKRYQEVFQGHPLVETPQERVGTQHVFHQYTIRIKDGRRDEVHSKLADAGIGTMIYYPVALHQLPLYQGLAHKGLPHTEKASGEVLSLPIWPTITPEIQLEVATAVRSALE